MLKGIPTYTVHVQADLVHHHFCGKSIIQADRAIKKWTELGWNAWKVLENNGNVGKSVLNHGKS